MNLRLFTGDNGETGPEFRASTTNGRLRARERAGRKAAGTSFQPSSPRMRATLRTAGIRPAVLTPKPKSSPTVSESGAGSSAASVEGTQAADVRLLIASEVGRYLSGLLPVAQPAPVVQESPVPTCTETLIELYETHLAPGEFQKNEAKTVRADISRIRKFQNWLDSGALRNTTPQRAYIECLAVKDVLFDFARFIRSQETKNSTATAMQAMNAIMKLARWAVENGHLKKVPKQPTRGDANEMNERLDEDDEFQGEPVTIPELMAMKSRSVLDGCDWPCFDGITPAEFWEGCLDACYEQGFRLQDWFAVYTTNREGLLWEDVITDTRCPKLDDLHNEFGWVWYVVNKTKKKAKRARKPVRQLAPLSRRTREFIEKFRGKDKRRVFPLPCNGRYWSAQVQGILLRAGLDDETRISQNKPIIKLTLGQAKVANLRKGCADMWASHLSEAASTYFLKHSVSDDEVSRITREHYLKIYRPLKEIVPAMQSLPIWN